MIRSALLSLLLFSTPAVAQVSPAADALSRATAALQAARTASDRISALSGVIRGFEQGLGEVRDTLRSAELQETQVRKRLDDASEDLAALLAVMQTMSRAQMPVSLLHPEGALAATRAGLMVRAIGPALQAEAQALASELDEARTLKLLQEDARKRLNAGLRDVQAARSALAKAVADRSKRPQRYADDPARLAALIDASETLDAFATSLIAQGPQLDPLQDALQKGGLALPVRGVVLRRFNQEDAAGIARPGWVVATDAGALVTSPLPVTLRYVGPFPGFDHVAILEPENGFLIILAGLGQTLGTAGQVLTTGDPVGYMAGNDEKLIVGDLGSGTNRTETLYIEVKQDQIAQDPNQWFAE